MERTERMKPIYLDNGTKAVEAVYHHFPLKEFNENPFIQALNPLASKTTIIEKMTVIPDYGEDERHADKHYRIYMLQRLYQLFQPLPIHVKVWDMIHNLIIEGYLARNPFDRDYIRYLNESGKEIINNTHDFSNNDKFRTTSSCGTFIGFSGMGKTTTVNRILNNISQVIVHNTYKGNHFNQIQLVWLKLEAPPTSSLKALCLQFFVKIDEVLGSNNYQKYVSRNSSVDSMLPVISQLAHNVGLGILVIDELQNIRSKGAHQILNFFVNLINSGVNIALIGTPGSYRLFDEELRMARRLTGSAEIIYENMNFDAEFKFLLESIWQYQWTKEHTPLSDEIVTEIYHHTQGISDLMVKLVIYSQQYAIETGKERLSVKLISRVAKERFKSLKPMIEAIRSGNPYKMAKYEDILKREWKTEDPVSIDKRKIVNRAKRQMQNKVQGDFSQRKKKKPVPAKNKSLNIEGDIRTLIKSDSNKTVYDHMKDNQLIDDLSEWM